MLRWCTRHLRSQLTTLGVAALALVACGSLAASDGLPLKDNFQPDACPFEVPRGVTVDCGYLYVPERRADPDSVEIELAVAVLRADSGQSRPDPIVYLAGGPGGSALDELARDAETWLAYPFRQDHDLVFVDQRGTGYSYPSLNCPEEEEAFDARQFERATVACRDRLLDEGVDLTAYNSAESAADVADLRVALGYHEWNVLGISYGTRLALTLMRDHPQGIRSVILDSTFPPNVNSLDEEAQNGLAAMRRLFAACAADPACDAAYPDLETVFVDTVRELNKRPDSVKLEDHETGELFDYDVYGDDLLEVVFQTLYVTPDIPYLPRMIYEVAEGEYEVFEVLAPNAGIVAYRGRQVLDEDLGDSEGMAYSVKCYEEVPFHDAATTAAHAEADLPLDLFWGLYGPVEDAYDACEIWPAGRAPDYENKPVASDLPTLILAGEFDPITPPEWGRLAAETLSNAYVFEFPGVGHAAVDGGDCPLEVVDRFLANPTRAPDAACLSAMPAPDFVGPDDPLDF